jgi:hypothetical protein
MNLFLNNNIKQKIGTVQYVNQDGMHYMRIDFDLPNIQLGSAELTPITTDEERKILGWSLNTIYAKRK